MAPQYLYFNTYALYRYQKPAGESCFGGVKNQVIYTEIKGKCIEWNEALNFFIARFTAHILYTQGADGREDYI